MSSTAGDQPSVADTSLCPNSVNPVGALGTAASVIVPIVTLTFVKLAVHRVVVTWLLTATPTNTFAARLENEACPTYSHAVPSTETYPLTKLPTRMSFVHCGAVRPGSVVVAVKPPAVNRPCKSAPPVGVTTRLTLLALAEVLSRRSTPPSAAPLVFCTEATRPTIWKSPVTDTYVNRNASALPPISTPAPCSVYVPVAPS